MEEIRSYILSVTAAAMLCTMVCAMTGKGGSLASLVKLMTGVVLAAVVISPIAKLSSVNLTSYLKDLNADAMAAVEAGTSYARNRTQEDIKDALEAYILDKADALSLDITIDLSLDSETMLPVSVRIDGAASPYARKEMENMLCDDLGIPSEGLIWK